VWAKKANVSEPLMTCRNEMQVTSKPRLGAALGAAWGIPVYCPGGVRHEGGASLARAPVWNVGTCRPAPVGGQWRTCWLAVVRGSENPKRQIREGESSDAGNRGGPPRGSCEAW
jgi:hypothetical protein